MKNKILKNILRFFTRGIIRRHKPLVVGVTGSVGKSSAKDAIALALSSAYTVRKTEGNLNNEFGIPLSVFGVQSGGGSLVAWMKILGQIFWRRYFVFSFPEVLVLEMGVDRPGDMEYLLSFVPVDVGVITHVSASHLKYFSSLSGIAKEKGALVKHFSPNSGIAILNADNSYTKKMKDQTNAKTVLTYGLSEDAIVRGTNVNLLQPGGGNIPSYTLKVEYAGKTVPLRLPHVIAEHHITAVLSAVAVCVALKLNVVEVVQKLESFVSLPGRLRAFPGIHETLLLDDTYNASPVSTKEAIRVLGLLDTSRRVAVLGDMLELGPKSNIFHQELYEDLLNAKLELVILVGEHMKHLWQRFQDEAREGVQVFWEQDPNTVAKNIPSVIKSGDSVLVKGSQGMRMEIVSKALLLEKERAGEYLCRQSESWLAKPFVSPQE